MSKTYMAKPGEVAAAWHVVDAEDKILGRMASRIALVLMGKHRPTYTPHVDTGDFVVVVNADKVRVTGKKLDQKLYYRRTSYIGNMKTTPMRKMMAQKPEFVIHEAVRRMLPKSKLGRKMLSKLKVYAGATHPHEAQTPQPLEL
ncbi:50S ribosomal protein L13 [bacterium]|nr:50S ribosomal protein L13 [bacterium]